MTAKSKDRSYLRELSLALVVYAVALWVALSFGQRLEPGVWQTAVYVSPMLPFLLAVWAIVRHVRRVDEFVRKVVLEHIAIAAAVTAGWTFTYGFLENAGYPRLTMFTVWPVMGAVWGLVAMMDSVRRR